MRSLTCSAWGCLLAWLLAGASFQAPPLCAADDNQPNLPPPEEIQVQLPTRIVQPEPIDPPQVGAPIDPENDPSITPGDPALNEALSPGSISSTAPVPFWARVPVVQKFPPLGWFFLPPNGPGYYSLADVLFGNYRKGPPKYPYPRFGIIPPSFFNADWRFLDDSNNEEHDYFDFLKRIHLGDNWLFTTPTVRHHPSQPPRR
jgi:hypothetical protein